MLLAASVATSFAIGHATIVAAPQDSSPRAKQIYARAVELDSQGNQPAALALLWEAAGLAPRDPDIQNALGEALERIGALDAAVSAYRAALQENPQFTKASNNLILALVKAGKGEEAVERAGARVAASPKDPDRHFTLGLAQSEQDIGEAIASFRRALALDPGHALARYNLALALNRSDRPTEAVEELKRTLATGSRAEAHYMLGMIYWHQGDFDGAMRALKAAIEAEPRYAEAHATLGAVLAARHEWQSAAAELRRAIALHPDPPTHYALARVLQQGGNASGAALELKEAERLRQQLEDDQQASVLSSVGTAKLDAGDLTAALELFRRATSISDRYAPAYYQMGRTLDRLGRDREARAAFSRAAALNPSLTMNR
jgi:tetratricopeptide (TPR) repeat protein